MQVSVLIPTKDEPYINTLIKELHQSLNSWRHEIIVIDKSHTVPEIQDAKLVIQESDGLGNAVLEGLEHAHGNIIVLMDGDGSHRPVDVPKLLEKIGEYDIVIGSRFISGGKTEDKTHRRIISWFFRMIANCILNLDVTDPMSGFSAVKRSVYESLNLRPLGYKINMEIMFKGKKKGYKVHEVPIIFLGRQAGKSKVGISWAGLAEGFRIIRYVFELKLGLR